MSRTVVLAMLFLGAFLLPPSTHGETSDITELSIEQLMDITVTGASRFEQKVSQAPSFVNVVTADEIKTYGYRTLADVLRSLPGFYVTYDRAYSYIGARGIGFAGDTNSRFLVLVDGHRLNENIYDSTQVGTDFILDIALIDRVEVIRGPGSALYGSNAFLGVINVITRKGGTLNGGEISGSAGSFDTYSGRATYGKRFQNGIEMLASGSINDSNGDDLYFKEFNSPSTNFGKTGNMDHDSSHSAFSKLSYRDFTLTGAFIDRTKGVPTGWYESDFNDDRNQAEDERAYIDLKYSHEFSKKISLKADLYYDRYVYKGAYPFSGILNKDYTLGTWCGANAMLTGTILEKHKVSIGGEYTDNMDQEQRNYDAKPFTLYTDLDKDSTQWAAFIQDEFRLSMNLILNVGVRYDYYSTSGGETNPRSALIYTPWDKTTFKLIYGSAFRVPNPFELYYSDPNYSEANPELEPERIRTYEVVLEQYLTDHLRLTTAAFHNEIKDLITQLIDPDNGAAVFINMGEIKTRGFEVQLEGNWKNRLEGRMSYTYQDAWDEETGSTLVNSPKHMFKLNLATQLISDKLIPGIEMQYMSDRKTSQGGTAGGFFITNLTLFSRGLLKGLELSVSAYNLFDKNYGDPGGEDLRQNTIGQDGRTFRLKVTYAF